MKKLVAIMLATLLALALFAVPVASADELEPVTLEWFIAVNASYDNAQEPVFEAMNNMTQEKLNLTVNYHLMPWATARERLELIVVTGAEKWDMSFVGSGVVDYVKFARANAFLALDDLLPVYAPKLFTEVIPAVGWEAVKVDGKIYATLPMKDWAERVGWIYNRTLTDDIGLDPTSLVFDKWTSLVPFMYEAKEGRDKLYPEYAELPIAGFSGFQGPANWLYERFIGGGNLAAINVASNMDQGFAGYAENEVFCPYLTDEWREMAKLRRQLTVDGICPSIQDWNPDYVFEPYVLGGGTPSGYVDWDEDQAMERSNIKTGILFCEMALVSGASIRNGLQAINPACENPERAMMLLEMANTDKDFMTTFAFGIEGMHWTDEDGDGVAEWGPLPDGTWRHWYPWFFGTITNIRVVPPNYNPDFPRLIEELNRNSSYSGVLAFNYNPDAVLEKIAACDAVHQEYISVAGSKLIDGLYDNVDELMDEFIDKLNANGLQDILADVQAQLDAFLKTL